jgi:hypothetical protein
MVESDLLWIERGISTVKGLTLVDWGDTVLSVPVEL